MSNKKKSDKQAAYERDNDSLRERIARMKEEHAEQIQAKNEQIERLRQGLVYELAGTFPNLRRLLDRLQTAATAASPLRSPRGDGRSSKKHYYPDDDAASTEAERSKIHDIDTELAHLADRVESMFTDREKGPLDIYKPQCWNDDCPARGWFQPLDATQCHTCGEPFGRYKPLNDLTQAVEKRCFTRGCPGRNKVNQCIHSWQKMDAALTQETGTG